MRLWEGGSAAFFIYVIAVALLLPATGAAARRRALIGAAAGLGAAFLSSRLPPNPIVHDWVLPPVLLLIAYWSSGALFTSPMPWAERLLERTDVRLGITQLAAAMPRPVVEILETAYAGVYPLIPIALGIRLTLVPGAGAERFWSVVLFTDFVCFGMLPWIQTRPPRALEANEPWRSSVRSFNKRLLGAASIHVNTFPSGHAAEALAAALLVTGAPAPVVVVMLVAALAVSAGAVLGRYHYALDAFAGWAVAVAVWLALGV